MTNPVILDFRIAGPGWADLEFKVGDRGFVAGSVSHTTDALGDLLRSAIMVATGAASARACFDREPLEWRLLLNSLLDENTGLGPVQIRVLEFDDFYRARPDAEGHEVFIADCGALEFAFAILAMAEKVEPSFEQFALKSQSFPSAARQALRGALVAYSGFKPLA
jgi:hypothetical protein